MAVQQVLACNSPVENWVMSPNTLMLCRVCQREGCNVECDACGKLVHLEGCARSNGDYVVRVVCYAEMAQRYGEQMMVQTQFLVNLLEQQRRARRAERFHRTVQVTNEVTGRAEAFGAGVGALLGGAAAATSGAVRGVAEGLQATLGGRSPGVEQENVNMAIDESPQFEEASEGRGGEPQIASEGPGGPTTPLQGETLGQQPALQDYGSLVLQQARELQELRDQL
eukprot:6464437-Amphidinium_carterae.1